MLSFFNPKEKKIIFTELQLLDEQLNLMNLNDNN